MAFRARRTLVATSLAQLSVAPLAIVQTTLAVVLIAVGAASEALDAEAAIAPWTADIAVPTDGLRALLTGPPVLAVAVAAAVGTGRSVPIGERHIWAVGVVGPEQTGDDHKEIEQSSFFQGTPDRLASVPFTDRFILHVGMCDSFVTRCRIRV